MLDGRPDATVKRLSEPSILYIPLRSRRFSFDEICVEQGRQINEGDVLARDPNNYELPLLAPRGGTVNLDSVQGHIVLTDIQPRAEKVHVPEKELAHIHEKMGAGEKKRTKLLELGAWEFFSDAYTGQLPDPMGKPQAVIVSTLSFEPFAARGDVQLKNRLLQFTRGLEHLQSFLEYEPIYLVLPGIRTEFEMLVKEHIRGYAWVKLIEIPMKYPYDNFNVLARKLGLKKSGGPIWSVRTEGILAVDRALTVSSPCLVRIVSIGGVGVNSPVHLKAMIGYPVKEIIDRYVFTSKPRVLSGGILTGKPVTEETLGLDGECRGLTVVAELEEREFLGFIRPGWDRSSYSGCFLSSLRKDCRRRLTTAMHGEGRPCVSCNYCEEVCPAGIMPHLLHKYLYSDLLEEVDQGRVDLCIECGLCSFVCPSKIDLRQQFIDAKELIEQEKEEIRKEQQRREKQQQEEELRRQSSQEAIE